MASISNTLKLNDKMSPVLNSIVESVNSTLRAMEGLDVAATSAFRNVKRDAAIASEAVEDFSNNFKDMPDPVKNTEKSFPGLISKAVSLTSIVDKTRKAFESVGKVTALSDSMLQSTSRLNLMNDGLETTRAYQDKIFASANRSRSSYAEMANTVTELGLNASDAFTGTDEIIAFSELMNQSFKLSGADAQAQAGAMQQLTQAMASGVVGGDALSSITGQAPLVYDAIAKYMGKSKGEVQALAENGALTADTFKNAMYAAAQDIESGFANMPPTFSQQMTQIKNNALKAFMPVLESISQIAQSNELERFIQNISALFYTAAEYTMQFMDVVGRVGAFVLDNGDIVLTILASISTALIILKAKSKTAGLTMMAAGIQAGVGWLATAWPILLVIGLVTALIIAYQRTEGVMQILIGVIGMVVLAVGAWVVVQWLLNTALKENPIGKTITIIFALIGVIIAIIAWVRNLWKTNMDFKYGILSIWDSIVFFFKGIPNFFQWVGNGIADAFGWAKVQVLMEMQNMANGAIDIINGLINLLNNIPSVAIDPIQQITFATSAAAEEEAKKHKRDAKLAANRAALEAEKAAQEIKRKRDRASDQAAIDAKEVQNSEKKSSYETDAYDYSRYYSERDSLYEPDAYDSSGFPADQNLGNIGEVGSVGKIDSDVTISEEDIKLLKDVAAQEYQLHYTQLTPNMSVQFGDVRETADAGAILSFIETSVSEALYSDLVVV